MTTTLPPAIPFSTPDVGSLEEQAALRVLRSGWLTTGEEALALERELSERLDGACVAVVSSCTAALEAALAYLRLPPGTVVAVPDWTFVATGSVPARLGLLPALVDVDPDTLNMSVPGLLRLLDDGPPPGAVVPVHFAGLPVDRRLAELCRERGIPVVHDSAHALGARDHRGELSARDVLAECFSFYATKNLTCAEGGAVVTRDPDLHTFVRSYRLHGLDGDAWKRHRGDDLATYGFTGPGAKSNLPDLLAAVARAQLLRFDAMQARRAAVVQAYVQELADVPGVRPLPSMGVPGNAHHLLVVLLDDARSRQRVRRGLADRGIGTSVHFPPLHTYAWFAEHAQLPAGGLPVSASLAGRALSLPLHPGLTPADAQVVCRALSETLSGTC